MQCFRRSRKCLDQSEASVAILGFESLQKDTTLLQNPHGNICGNAFSGSEEKVENVKVFDIRIDGRRTLPAQKLISFLFLIAYCVNTI